jgi:hypothetical protein
MPPATPEEPRFLPTLTQVVHPDELAELSLGALPTAQMLFDLVRPQVELEIDRQLALAREQPTTPQTIHELHQRLLQQLDRLVREAVHQALADWPKKP